MSRLRHPIRAIREPFGKAGLAVAILALVMAMVGGAYAAAGLNGKQKKEVTKIAKKYAGKPGAPGAAGTNGTNGSNGTDGADGTNGAPGKSVVVGSFTGEDEENEIVPEECDLQGGLEVAVEGSGNAEIVCNGEEGPEGPEGALGTAGTTLPEDATETGAWGKGDGGTFDVVSISFSIPLAAALPASNVHWVIPATGTGDLTSGSTTVSSLVTSTGAFESGQRISGTGIPAGTTITAVTETTLTLSAAATATASGVNLTTIPDACENASHPGTASVANPEADSGHLCAYRGEGVASETVEPGFGNPGIFKLNSQAYESQEEGASVAGAVLPLVGSAGGFGSWAVTG